MSKRVHEALVKQGINVRTGTRIQRAEEAKLVTSEEEVISADLQVWAAGIKCADWLSELDGLETNRINQLIVEQTLRTTNDSDIFVIGDSAECPQSDGFLGLAKKYAKVSGPNRPINIMKMITNSPGSDKLPVKPRDNPTVPSAETASNIMSNIDAFSVSNSVNMANQVTPTEIRVSANA